MSRETKTIMINGTSLDEEEVDITSLVDNPRNPNSHSDEQIKRLMASLTAYGQYKPVLVRRTNRMMIAGHGLRMAARRLGWTHIRCVLWDVDQERADRAMLGDNRLGELSDPDNDRVAELLREIPEADWLSVGFAADEAAKLFGAFDDSSLTVREVQTATVADNFWIHVFGPLGSQADVLQRIKQLLTEFPGVTVELGITQEG